MQLYLVHHTSAQDFTTGRLYTDGVFESYTLEDEKRTVKVWGETRIPDGTYEIKLRAEGQMHQRYLERFGESFHVGMLHLQNVPGFECVYIHVGNTDDDTAGCILVGRTVDERKGILGQSVPAYKTLYAKVAERLLCGDRVFITIRS